MKISQREARRLKKRVEALENYFDSQRRAWSGDWPGGVNIATVTVGAGIATASIDTARRLGHAVVATVSGGDVRFYALALPKAKP